MDGVWKDIYLEVKKAINHFYDRDVFYITTKEIRKYLDIDASDRTKISFIWRILQHLMHEGFLTVIEGKSPKQYKISKFPIENNVTFVAYQLIEKGHLLRKIGFYRTINILPSDGRPIKLSEFYAKLIKFDNYNTFIRVKSELLKKKIIDVDYDQKLARCIRLTKNGVVLKLKLKELIQQIEKGDEK